MSVRIAAISDTHGNIDALRAAAPLLRALKPAKIAFLGDGIVDVGILPGILKPCPDVVCVCGNVDPQGSAELFRVEEWGSVRVLLTHGHRYHVKEGTGLLVHAAQEMGCDVALYGHTHVPDVQSVDGVLLVNPGSLGRSFDGAARIALLSIEEGKAQGYLMRV